MANKSTNNFSSGEWTSFLDGRADLQKYDSACLTMQNFRPLPWGGASYRAGLLYNGSAKYSDRPNRLIPFNYSTSLSFIIEMGDLYLRFWNADGTPVNVSGIANWVSGHSYVPGDYVSRPGQHYYNILATSGSTAPESDPTHWSAQEIMEVVAPWSVGQINAVQFKQINAQMRLVHGTVAPQTLTYSGGGLPWSLATTVYKYPVLRDQNAVQASVLNVAALSGGTTMTASVAGTFNANHIGSYWELQHLRPAASRILDLNNQSIGVQVFSSTIQMNGAWTFETSQFWYGTVQVQRSVDGGTTWQVIREFEAKSNGNFSTSGNEGAPQIGLPAVLYRIAYTMAGAPFDAAVWVGTAPSQYPYAQATLESQDAYIAGVVKVTAFTDSQNVSVLVIIPPQSTATTYLWSEGAFSDYRGFPQAIAFYEQRLLYSGTTAQPNTIWGSVTGDFDNFQYSSGADDAAVAFQPAVCQQNRTAWISTLTHVHMGTNGEEIVMASGNFDEPLTPSNVTMRAQSFYGSTPIQPIQMQNSILFMERNGLRVRELRELSPYAAPTDFDAPDLTLMSEHITKPGITLMDFAKLPDPLAYFVRSDGVLAVCTYNRQQNITAWARYVTDGLFESVAAVYGSPSDIVWVSVKRVINGTTIRTIEAFTTSPAEYPNIQTNCLLDCATAYTVPSGPISAITGLTRFMGGTVTAVIDGAEYTGLEVTSAAGGTLTFPDGVTASNYVRVGLPYTGQISPMKPELVDQSGSSQGKKRRDFEIIVRVRNSLTMAFGGGPSPASFTEIPIRTPNDAPGTNNPLSDGVVDIVLPGPWPAGNDFSGQVTLQQTHPFPLTVLAIFCKFDVF